MKQYNNTVTLKTKRSWKTFEDRILELCTLSVLFVLAFTSNLTGSIYYG